MKVMYQQLIIVYHIVIITTHNNNNNSDLLEKDGGTKMAYTRINGLSFKVSSVHIDCY